MARIINLNDYSYMVEYYADGWQVEYFSTESEAQEFIRSLS